ncbi:MAG TPA: DAK2 domain-containing protein [Thermoanaerobacterales bacterium]|nr:DAK2 domain-containing protein [Thermoanaerobacterales bacterium]
MKVTYIDGNMYRQMLKRSAKILKNNRELVDSLNVFPVPDGDTGTNMSLTLDSAVKEMEREKENSIGKMSAKVARGSLMGARGNSGVILSQIFRGIAKSFEYKDKINSRDFALALQSGSDTAYKAVMKPVEGTILTVIRECANKALDLANKNISLDDTIEETFNHSMKVLAKTQYILPALKEAGVVDAGGKGFVFIIQGMYEIIKGIEDKQTEVTEDIEKDVELSVIEDDIEFQYCTELIIEGKNMVPDVIKNELVTEGDSLLVVGDEDIVKLHIHTNNPGKILEYCLKFGELNEIKIDNMKKQHNEYLRDTIQEETKDEANAEIDEGKIGIISVVSGDGLKDIYKSLGCDKVIWGGQTMNPSTQDILDSINELNFREIIILPNNSNIILTALQAQKMSDKNIFVIPTKNIPQGISALLAFNVENDINLNVKNMEDSIKDVKTIEITFAVRDSTFNGMEIKEGNIIGLADGEIKHVGDNVDEVLLKTLKEYEKEDLEFVTIFYGEDVKESEADDLVGKIQNISDEWEIESHFGGQPLYYYIVSME